MSRANGEVYYLWSAADEMPNSFIKPDYLRQRQAV
jgi:hypothetical protein